MFTRKKKEEQQVSVDYDFNKEPLSISQQIMNAMLDDEKYSIELIGLYAFYYYTAKWQRTSVIKALNIYTAKKLKIGVNRVSLLKKRLIELGLIKDVIKRDIEGRQFAAHYIQLNLEFYIPTFLERFKNDDVYSLKKNSIYAYSEEATIKQETILENNYIDQANNFIKPSQFYKFWALYPKHLNQAKAKIAWDNACKRPKDTRPTLHQVLMAVIQQNKTPQWGENNGLYIPHATTWLNQGRWTDDPKQMNGYASNKFIERYECPYNMKFGKDWARGREGCMNCQDKHENIWHKCQKATLSKN
jgi:hypothetical protein